MMTDKQHELIRSYLDGVATDEQVRELDRLLQDDKALRNDFLVESVLDSRLRRVADQANRAAETAGKTQGSGARRILWRPRFVFATLAAAAGLVLAVGASWFVQHRALSSNPTGVAAVSAPVPVEAVGRLTSVRGDVRLAAADGTEQPVREDNRRIVAGQTLIVGDNADAVVEYTDGSKLSVFPLSRLLFGEESGAKRLTVHGGAFDADIVPQPAGRSMLISTTRLTDEVIGTEFRVVDNDEASWLTVRSGCVKVTRNADGHVLAVGNGQYAAAHPIIPFTLVQAQYCPFWKATCQALGSRYP